MAIASHSSNEVHKTLLIFPAAENGPFLLVEATVCCRFCYGRQAEVEQTHTWRKESGNILALLSGAMASYL